jgi:hypothetical protein
MDLVLGVQECEAVEHLPADKRYDGFGYGFHVLIDEFS